MDIKLNANIDLSENNIQLVETVLPCQALEEMLLFFKQLGFKLERISPADKPEMAIVVGYGMAIRLLLSKEITPVTLIIRCKDPAAIAQGQLKLTAPNGASVLLEKAVQNYSLPPLQSSFVLNPGDKDEQWHIGRAGMYYRDLIPDRQGGRFIASHIKITGGGSVPDYVHYHKVRFQLIYCYKGWVKLVYEDQGPPFVMRAGDCLLQPPQIRHRVLESADDLEVVEVGCPALHDTYAEHGMALPTALVEPLRLYQGQHFVFHQSAQENWQGYWAKGFSYQDSGLAKASAGVVDVKIVRHCGGRTLEAGPNENELLFLFVLSGSLKLTTNQCTEAQLNPGGCCVIAVHDAYAFKNCSRDLKFLEVAVSAADNAA